MSRAERFDVNTISCRDRVHDLSGSVWGTIRIESVLSTHGHPQRENFHMLERAVRTLSCKHCPWMVNVDVKFTYITYFLKIAAK